jgi:hypothetical protein
VWLSQQLASNIMLAAFGVLLIGFSAAIVREQVIQHRPITLVVDHDRGLLRVGGREIRIEDVKSVDVVYGRALYWSSGKNEHIPGYRIVVTTRSGNQVPATKDFRAGGHAHHERARDALLNAMSKPA